MSTKTFTLVNGIEVDVAHEDSALRISDKDGEIVMWNYSEIREDPEAWTATICAIIRAMRFGPESLREAITWPSAVEPARPGVDYRRERDEARAEVKLLCEAAENLMASMGCGCCGGDTFRKDEEKLRDAIERAEKVQP